MPAAVKAFITAIATATVTVEILSRYSVYYFTVYVS